MTEIVPVPGPPAALSSSRPSGSSETGGTSSAPGALSAPDGRSVPAGAGAGTVAGTDVTAAAGDEHGFEVMRSDTVSAGRAMSTAEYLAGLIAAGQLDTVGSPRKLPRDMWPDVDPVLVQEIWQRALVVGVRAGQFMVAPRFHRDKLARLRGELSEAGHRAMGDLVGRSLSVVERHPADEGEGREH